MKFSGGEALHAHCDLSLTDAYKGAFSADFLARRAFVLWKFRHDPETGRKSKVPVVLLDGKWKNISYKDEILHLTGDRALDLLNTLADDEGECAYGIGIAMREEHGFTAIDLDNSIYQDGPHKGECKPWFHEIVKILGPGISITLSPSGKGHRIFAAGVYAGEKHYFSPSAVLAGYVPNDPGERIEIASSNKFVTVTPNTVPGSSRELSNLPSRLKALEELLNPAQASEPKPAAKRPKVATEPVRTSPPVDNTDQTTVNVIISRLCSNKSNEKLFRSNIRGTTGGDGSQSCTDMALIHAIRRITGNNHALIRAVMLRSALFRSKWLRSRDCSPAGGPATGCDWLDYSIFKALSFHRGESRPNTPSIQIVPPSLASIPEPTTEEGKTLFKFFVDMQKRFGRAIHLSCEAAAKLIGKSVRTAWRCLNSLMTAGIITRTHVGEWKGDASEFVVGEHAPSKETVTEMCRETQNHQPQPSEQEHLPKQSPERKRGKKRTRKVELPTLMPLGMVEEPGVMQLWWWSTRSKSWLRGPLACGTESEIAAVCAEFRLKLAFVPFFVFGRRLYIAGKGFAATNG